MDKAKAMVVLAGLVVAVVLAGTYFNYSLWQQSSGLQALPAGNGSGSLQEANPLGQSGSGQAGSNVLLFEESDPSIGPKDAMVTVVEFSDFECPYCGAAAGTHAGLISSFKARDPSWEAAVPKLEELARQGRIRFVYRDFPLSFHQDAQKAAEAAECADEQGEFWEMHDKIFENQDAIGVSSLKQYARDIGLDSAQFDACLDSGQTASEVKKDLADGQKLGVSGTPAFFINGQLVSGAQPFSVFEKAIEAELAKGSG